MIERISTGIYAETSAECITSPFGEPLIVDRGANPCCVITEKGIVQIDTTKNPIFALDWIRSIRRKSDKAFKYVINTDHHLDHIMGNSFFESPVITHHLAALEVKNFARFEPQKLMPFMYSKQLNDMLLHRDDAFIEDLTRSFEQLDERFRTPCEHLRIVPAEITFDQQMSLHMGNVTLELLHVGGHTAGSILVYLREQRVLFAGDSVFNNLLPSMTQADSAKWLDVISLIEKMDVEIIVPGHGHPCDKTPLKKLKAYILELRNRVGVLQRRGYGKDEIISKIDLTSFFPLDVGLGWTEKRICDWCRGNTGRVFDELSPKGA